MGDALSDLRGESVDEPVTTGDSASGTSFYDVLTAPFDAAAAIITGAQDTAASVFGAGADVITGFQDTAGNIVDTGGEVYEAGFDAAESVLNPFGLAGLGVGLSVGGILTVLALGVGTALIADEFTTGGAGRTAAFSYVRSKRKR